MTLWKIFGVDIIFKKDLDLLQKSSEDKEENIHWYPFISLKKNSKY